MKDLVHPYMSLRRKPRTEEQMSHQLLSNGKFIVVKNLVILPSVKQQHDELMWFRYCVLIAFVHHIEFCIYACLSDVLFNFYANYG